MVLMNANNQDRSPCCSHVVVQRGNAPLYVTLVPFVDDNRWLSIASRQLRPCNKQLYLMWWPSLSLVPCTNYLMKFNSCHDKFIIGNNNYFCIYYHFWTPTRHSYIKPSFVEDKDPFIRHSLQTYGQIVIMMIYYDDQSLFFQVSIFSIFLLYGCELFQDCIK